MFKYKILKIGIAALSLISFLTSSFSDYIKEKTIRRFDLRWHQAVDERKRIHTIIVRNAGSEPRENLVLELDFGHNLGTLADFAVLSDEIGPAVSFLDAVERANAGQSASALGAAETSKLSKLLDRHSADRGLDDLDDTFDEILKSRLMAANGAKGLAYLQTNSQQTMNWHIDWYHKCASKPSAECDKINSVFVEWEKARTAFRNAAIENWQDHTKMTLDSESDHLSLDNKLLLTLSLAPNESRILKFHYAHDPATVYTTFRSSTGKQTYQLNSADEVFSSFLRVLFALHPVCYLIIFVLTLAVFRYGPMLLPLNIVPVYKIFNFALESKDEDYWKHALERHRFFILRQFRLLKQKEKSSNAMTEQEVLDYVRDWLAVRDDSGLPKFQSGKVLNRSMHNQLWRLVLETR